MHGPTARVENINNKWQTRMALWDLI